MSVPSALIKQASIPLDQRAAWSVAETARALGISERTVSKLIASGELPVSRVGRRILICPVTVRSWLAKQRVG